MIRCSAEILNLSETGIAMKYSEQGPDIVPDRPRAPWADNDPKRERGWVVKRFSRGHPASYVERHKEDFSPLEEAIRCSVSPEGQAQAWLRTNANHFTFGGISTTKNSVTICGRLT